MTFAIHASKNGQSVVTVRIRPDATVDKARLLERFGWKVHITDSAGHRFGVSDFDRFFGSIERSGARKSVVAVAGEAAQSSLIQANQGER